MIELEITKQQNNKMKKMLENDSIQLQTYKETVNTLKDSCIKYSDLCDKLEKDNTKIKKQRNIFIVTTIVVGVLSLFFIVK